MYIRAFSISVSTVTAPHRHVTGGSHIVRSGAVQGQNTPQNMIHKSDQKAETHTFNNIVCRKTVRNDIYLKTQRYLVHCHTVKDKKTSK